MPDGVLLDAPEQCRLHLARDDRYAFGLTLLAHSRREASERLDQLIDGLRKVGRHAPEKGVALGGNFAVAVVEDLVAGQPRAMRQNLEPIGMNWIADELDRLGDIESLTLRFLSPLRAQRSKRNRGTGHGHFDRELFESHLFIDRLVARLRTLGILSAEFPRDPTYPRVGTNQLVWLDASYGPRSHRKALGGAVGRLVLEECGPSTREVLVWGQYARVGGQTRFGFGSYRLEALGPDPFACRRSASLLELAESSAALDQAAADLELESGGLRQVLQEVRAGAFLPEPHARVEIPAKGNKSRLLSIPSRRDRALQKMILHQIAPGIDRFLEDSSLAYRKGLGRHRAAMRIRDAYRQGYRWGVRADFASFFDRVDLGELEARLEAYLADDELTRLIMVMVRSGAPTPNRGLPTGAPLSPLLANLLLDHFDEQVEREGGLLVRYADDFLILFRKPEEAERLYRVAQATAETLQLELNQEKTSRLGLDEPFTFLGFRFEKRESWEASALSEPAELDDIGWHDSSRSRPTSAAATRMPGESSLNPRSPQGTVIWGPSVSALRTQGNQLRCIHADSRGPTRVPLNRVRELFVLGSPTVDGPALKAISKAGISVFLTDDVGRVTATIFPEDVLEDARGVAGQVTAQQDASWRLEISRKLVAAKLRNYATLADVYRGQRHDWTTGKELRGLADAAEQADSVERLLGLEGAGAARWYGEFASRLPSSFTFERRVAPAASDPVNIMLNIAQTVLYRHLMVMIRQMGLVPSVGILHRPRVGHAALASDLQEPFRHLMDRAVLEAARRIRPTDFSPQDHERYPLRILPRASRELLGRIHQILAISCCGKAQSEPRPYRMQMLGLARSLRTHLIDRQKSWKVFEHP